MRSSVVTKQSVLAAIAECDDLGRVAFRRKYGFGRAISYELVYEGRRYDSKAIFGVAYQYATGQQLQSNEFAAGAQYVVGRLRELGFAVGPQFSGTVPPVRAPLVLIAPCYGNPASRARFAETLASEVSFVDEPVRGFLDADEFEALIELHPGGTARFWGALSRHDAKMDRLTTGDAILFTGRNRVQALGKLGCKLRSKKLADLLWKPDPKTGSWSNVYTILGFQYVSHISYGDIQDLAGYSPKDVFQETRVPRPEQAAALIAGLGLDEVTAKEEPEGGAYAEVALLDALAAQARVSEAETNRTHSSEYHRAERRVTMSRAEAQLVDLFWSTLPVGQAKSLHVAGGRSDLFIVDGGELIEAKKSATHRYVRQALGQLLDYAAHAKPVQVQRLTALFPHAPAGADVRLLHMYGIDCLYWTGGLEFSRLEAPREARDRMRAIWTAGTS